MAIEIVDFPSKNGGSFHSYVKLPEGMLLLVSMFLPIPSFLMKPQYLTISNHQHQFATCFKRTPRTFSVVWVKPTYGKFHPSQKSRWWFGTWLDDCFHFIYMGWDNPFHIYGFYFSISYIYIWVVIRNPLTFTPSFFRGVGQPPTSHY